MGQGNIRKRLRRYARASRKVVSENQEIRIQELMQAAGLGTEYGDETVFLQGRGAEHTRGTLYQFFLEQIGYVGRYCLVWQALWSVAFFWVMQAQIPQFIGGEEGGGVLLAISLLAPLLVLLTAEEITKVYLKSMLEIEYATKYSLRSVVISRMAILCMAHSVVLAVCTVCLPEKEAVGALHLLVYGFTPMILMTGILMKLMQYFQGESLRSAAVGVYVLMVILAVVGSREYFGWYQPSCFRIWCLVCVAGAMFGMRQFVCLHKKLSSFEQIAQKWRLEWN